MMDNIINKKYMKLFISLDNKVMNIIQCSKKIGMTNPHLSKILKEFVKEGLIIKKKNTYYRRSFDLILTEKGKSMAKLLRKLKKIGG